MSVPVTILLAACGAGTDPAQPAEDSPTSAETTSFTCDPAAAPSPTPMRRLSRAQYAATVDAAIELLGGDELRALVGDPVAGLVERVPDDVVDKTLGRQDQAVSQEHVEAWYLVAEAVADGVVDARTLPCPDAACVPELVATLGARLQRRPLTAEEQAFYVDDVYGAAPEHADGLRDLVLVWLSSPSFTMQVEHGQGDEQADVVALTAHELASRLSYHAWNAPPDDELWALAESGALLDDATYAAQVDRLFDDPRSQGPREQFFVEWLQIDDLPRLDGQVGMPQFDAFRGAITPGPDLHERVQRDALDLLEWHVRHGSALDDVWTEPVHTVMDPEVAALYGVSDLWDGVSEPTTLATGHGGLLTRPAFHVTGNAVTRPIHKGVVIRRRVLCDALGEPPADLGPEPEIDPAASTRTRTEQLTEIDGSICASCHGMINGLGYVTERFDALGRVRAEEQVLDEDGQVLATWPIDDHAVARVELTDEAVLQGPDALAEALAASEKVEACTARFWFRHTWGRDEDDAVDGCVLQEVQQRLAADEPLDAALRASALSETFRIRRLDDEGGAR